MHIHVISEKKVSNWKWLHVEKGPTDRNSHNPQKDRRSIEVFDSQEKKYWKTSDDPMSTRLFFPLYGKQGRYIYIENTGQVIGLTNTGIDHTSFYPAHLTDFDFRQIGESGLADAFCTSDSSEIFTERQEKCIPFYLAHGAKVEWREQKNVGIYAYIPFFILLLLRIEEEK